ncbi:MAG TPA: hypothetical protein VGW37_14840 [Terriglobia bacterium]|nr:hypothetical protein [Terriglobia bacterium]
MGQKRCYFEKRTGEVVENKESAPKNEPKRTGKRSREVVENTYLWKKRTENEPKTKRAMLLKIQDVQKPDRQQTAPGISLDADPAPVLRLLDPREIG